MHIRQEISRLLRANIVIRHRSPDEEAGADGKCCVCSRKIRMIPGNLCVAVGDDEVLCSVCATEYAPEMAAKIREQLPETDDEEPDIAIPGTPEKASRVELSSITNEINALRDISNDLAKGISRGIVEAPAGHIGLLHFAKDIQKPPRKVNESEENYALRIRTHRMTRLYEILSRETVGRIDRIKAFLVKHGLLK